jgi:hypothetical protein
MRGMQKNQLESYINEYLWRSWHIPRNSTAEDILYAFITTVNKNN